MVEYKRVCPLICVICDMGLRIGVSVEEPYVQVYWFQCEISNNLTFSEKDAEFCSIFYMQETKV